MATFCPIWDSLLAHMVGLCVCACNIFNLMLCVCVCVYPVPVLRQMDHLGFLRALEVHCIWFTEMLIIFLFPFNLWKKSLEIVGLQHRLNELAKAYTKVFLQCKWVVFNVKGFLSPKLLLLPLDRIHCFPTRLGLPLVAWRGHHNAKNCFTPVILWACLWQIIHPLFHTVVEAK